MNEWEGGREAGGRAGGCIRMLHLAWLYKNMSVHVLLVLGKVF